jgi:hypothetical protein
MSGGMSEVRTSASTMFEENPGCGNAIAVIFLLIIGTPILMVVNLWNKYDQSCAKRACRPQNCIVAEITETNRLVQEELSVLCKGHLEGPVISIEDDGKFNDEFFYKVKKDFPWKSKWPRPRFVHRSYLFSDDEPCDVYIYAIFVKPDPKQKTREWWSANGYGEYGRKGQSVKYRSSEWEETFIGSETSANFIGKSRGRLYLVDFEYDEEYPPTYLLEAATKQTDRRHVRESVKALQDMGE